MRFLFLCLLLFTAFASGQPAAPQGPLTPPRGETVLAAKRACADLRSLTGYDFSVETATVVAAIAGVPEHCRVRGQILPEIRFQVDLPASWNRRFYMFGNGGYAGESQEQMSRSGGHNLALQRGFAVAFTNTGHDDASEPLATFAQNRQKLLDYAFRSLHATVTTAKQLVAAYYEAKPSRSYYEGCSTGGREGLIFAQRFPDDFDGIVAGAPVLNFTGTMMSYAYWRQAFAAAPIPSSKVALLAKSIYGQCDAKDGVQDGLIDDPRQCGFRPSRDLPKCAADADGADCFTAAQIGTLEKFYGDVMSGGQRLFPGWPVGSEIAGPNGRSGWDPWIVRENGPPIQTVFAETFFRYMAFPEKNPKYELASFDVEKDPAKLEWIHNVLDATDPDLSRFQSRGGKMLMYFGWADPALNPQMGVDYYESVRSRMGAGTPGFFRLFMVPGMFHCGGGPGPSNFDKLIPVLDWVEKGTAPERITASRAGANQPARTRPLCSYPQVAKYKGSGSIDDAANFTCSAPSAVSEVPRED